MARKNQFTREQILRILEQYDRGECASVAELCRQHRISRQAYYYWRAKYGTASNGHLRLFELEAEVSALRRMVSVQMSTVAELQGQLSAVRHHAHLERAGRNGGTSR